MTTLRFTDNFDGVGDLNGSPVGATGATWAALAGAWARSSGAAKTTAAVGTNPMLVMDAGVGDVDVRVNAYTGFAGGDALYFRVSDTSNWWRLRQRAYQESYSYPGTTTVTDMTWYLSNSYDENEYSPPGTYYGNYVGGTPTSKTVITRIAPSAGGTPRVHVDQYYRNTSYSPGGSGTTKYRYLMLEKCASGVVSGVTNVAVSAFAVLRIVANGDQIQVFNQDQAMTQRAVTMPDGTVTYVYEPAPEVPLRTVTDAFNKTATKHGLGLGGTDNYTTASSLDNFVLQRPGTLAPPTIASPASGSDVSIADPIALSIQSNYGPGNPMGKVDLRYTLAGSGAWTVVDGARTGPGAWTLPVAGFSALDQVEVQARSTDSFSNLSDWSPSTYLTLRQPPTAPTFVEPDVDGVVIVAGVALVDFGDDATETQARRVGDADGTPDLTTVYEDDASIVPAAGYDRVVGDPAVHEVGVEHVQVRRRTADGGALWSPWASRRVVLELGRPFPPRVTYTVLPDDAAVEFAIRFYAPDAEHYAAERLDIYRDGERILSVDVTDVDAYRWVDAFAGPSGDYEFRAVSSNGGTVIVR